MAVQSTHVEFEIFYQHPQKISIVQLGTKNYKLLEMGLKSCRTRHSVVGELDKSNQTLYVRYQSRGRHGYLVPQRAVYLKKKVIA